MQENSFLILYNPYQCGTYVKDSASCPIGRKGGNTMTRTMLIPPFPKRFMLQNLGSPSYCM
jgi:hypothetical protein